MDESKQSEPSKLLTYSRSPKMNVHVVDAIRPRFTICNMYIGSSSKAVFGDMSKDLSKVSCTSCKSLLKRKYNIDVEKADDNHRGNGPNRQDDASEETGGDGESLGSSDLSDLGPSSG